MIALEEQNEESKKFLTQRRRKLAKQRQILNMKQGKVCCEDFVKPM